MNTGYDISYSKDICSRLFQCSQAHERLCNMTKHSKNNTASSIFSYAEYKKLDYGTKRVSLNFFSRLQAYGNDMYSNV